MWVVFLLLPAVQCVCPVSCRALASLWPPHLQSEHPQRVRPGTRRARDPGVFLPCRCYWECVNQQECCWLQWLCTTWEWNMWHMWVAACKHPGLLPHNVKKQRTGLGFHVSCLYEASFARPTAIARTALTRTPAGSHIPTEARACCALVFFN